MNKQQMMALTEDATPEQEPETALSIAKPKEENPNVQLDGNVFASSHGFELAQRMAKALVTSDIVPKRFQGLQNIGSALIVLNMAQRMGSDPLMTMQNLYVVHGSPSFSSQFMTAIFNQSGRYSTMKYRFSGEEGKDDWGCRAYATELSTGEEISGPLVTIDVAKKEGWYGKAGSKWQTIPELMLRYRAAAWLIRTTAPELSMGMQTKEELVDVYGEDAVSKGGIKAGLPSFMDLPLEAE
jgi:hypothetical protein